MTRSALALAAAAILLNGCGNDAPANPSSAPPPAPVSTLTATPADIAVSFSYPARLYGAREVEIRPRVSGILLKRNYTEGAVVDAGQSLFQIDPVPFETALARAEADLAAAQARLEQARREAARLKPLVAVKAAPQRDYDDAVSAQSVANADLLAARADVREARLNLGYTKVTSPISGVSARAVLPEGSLLSGPDSLLTVVTQTDPLQVRFGLPDTDRARIDADLARGALKLIDAEHFRVALSRGDGSRLEASATLSFTDVRIDPRTGSSEAQAELPNPGARLHPGEFVRVHLEGAVRPGAIAVPQRAVLEGPQGRFVYLVVEGKAASRPVTPVEWVGDTVIVDGLAAGDEVIIDGVLKIGPGAPVTVTPPAGGAAKPGA
ncbi:MAG: efflux RND transporter periplasmic adaptor subunit [Rhodocyclaceae bacterium]|nr:efflux RND transporter periplasmic adaptor subunit [Rhodocyclaceae bacterium]